VIAVPRFGPSRRAAPERAPRTNVIVVRNELELPPRAAAPEARGVNEGDAEDTALADGARPAETGPDEDYGVSVNSNRVAAIATLRNIISAQSQFQSTARADEDGNGVGEYGSFGEMSGAVGVRDGEPLNPPVLSRAFKKVEHGYVERSGYRYRMYLPQGGGRPVPERDRGGFSAGEVDPPLAETCWCCYAWPVDGDGPTFFTNEAGDVLATDGGFYFGDREPPPYAAFRDASGLGAATVIDLPEDARIGADGRTWKPAG